LALLNFRCQYKSKENQLKSYFLRPEKVAYLLEIDSSAINWLNYFKEIDETQLVQSW